MITLEQLLNSVKIIADTVDIHSWNEKEWDYDDFFGFCGHPTSEFLLERCKEVKDYKVIYIETDDNSFDGGYLRIEIQKGE